MSATLTPQTGPEAVNNRIFKVVPRPLAERVRWVRGGYQINIGDYGWDTLASPENGLVHLSGYDEDFLIIWHADFELQEVRYVGPKPLRPNKPNAFPVRSRL